MPEPAGQDHGAGNTAASARQWTAVPRAVTPRKATTFPHSTASELPTLEHPSMQMLLGLPLICSVLLLHL